MIRFHYNTGPNPKKIALFLEESGLPYEGVPVDTRRGEQHLPAFTALNPNAKAPVIEDDGVVVFDSNAILLYLAEKHGCFLPKDPKLRGPMLSWLMFVATGVGPYMGQAVHFGRFAPEPMPYATNRYRKEAERHWRILDDRLAGRSWILGEDYTIVDMAAWGWSGALPFALGDDAALDRFPNVKRWREAINARPAAERALKLGADVAWKTEMDEDARRAMFPSNY
jgi:GST-like protein